MHVFYAKKSFNINIWFVSASVTFGWKKLDTQWKIQRATQVYKALSNHALSSQNVALVTTLVNWIPSFFGIPKKS